MRQTSSGTGWGALRPVLDRMERTGFSETRGALRQLRSISEAAISPDSIKELPLVLRHIEMARARIPEERAELRDQCSRIVRLALEAAVNCSLNRSGSTEHYELMGEGANNWALSDGEIVLLVSKGSSADPMASFHTRELAATLMNGAGLNQPKVLAVEAEPFPHMTMQLAAGRRLNELMAENSSSYALECSLTALGRFLRSCAEISLDGYGKIERSNGSLSLRYTSKAELFANLRKRFRSPNSEERSLDERLQELGGITASELDLLKESIDRLIAYDEQAMLANADPNPMNFLYDFNKDHINALDMEAVSAMPPSQFFGFMYQSWILVGGSQDGHAEDRFLTVLESFEANPRKCTELYELSLVGSAIGCHWYAAKLLKNGANEQNAVLNETPKRFLDLFRLALCRLHNATVR